MVRTMMTWRYANSLLDVTPTKRAFQNAEWGTQLDGKIAKLSAEIEHMAPNMKATERLGDVEHKLRDAEGEADAAKKESKAARDRFNDVKRRRSGS